MKWGNQDHTITHPPTSHVLVFFPFRCSVHRYLPPNKKQVQLQEYQAAGTTAVEVKKQGTQR